MLSSPKSFSHNLAAFTWLARSGLFVTALWGAIALLFAIQGYAVAAYRETPQAWWPSLGYSAAIFSIWALLTPLIILFSREVQRRLRAKWHRLAAHLLALPLVAALHIVLFAALYWPVYNDGGRIPDRWAMGERMFYPNLDTNILFYTLIVGFTLWRGSAMKPGLPEPAAPPGSDAQASHLQVRIKGGFRLVPAEAVRWIAAAGNYSELHSADGTFLLDESLSSLEQRLPARRFARVHRGAIVRLDQLEEVRGIGRGDALLRLKTGEELRLSRRFRPEFYRRLGERTSPIPAAE